MKCIRLQRENDRQAVLGDTKEPLLETKKWNKKKQGTQTIRII
jgi:hypothetical protein